MPRDLAEHKKSTDPLPGAKGMGVKRECLNRTRVTPRELFKAGDSGGVLFGFVAAEAAPETAFDVNSHSTLSVGRLSRPF